MIEEISKLDEIENLYKDGVNAPYQKVVNGSGYHGVLIKDKSTGKVQCHVCGKFYESIPLHSYQKHKLNAADYKLKYGFASTFPLCSVKVSKQRREKSMRDKMWELGGLEKYKKARLAGLRKRHKQGGFSLAFVNSRNICNEQIYRRYMLISDKIGSLPSAKTIRKYDPPLDGVIRSRFGSFNKFKLKFNLPANKRNERNPHSNDRILSILRGYYKKELRIPLADDFKRPKMGISQKVILARFGSWNRAMMMAGFRSNSNHSGKPEFRPSGDMIPLRSVA